MPIKGASEVEKPDAGDRTSHDLNELVKGAPPEGIAVMFSVTEVCEEQSFNGNAPMRPIRCILEPLTGPHAGEVDTDHLVFKGGVRNRLTTVGDDVVGRLTTVKHKGRPIVVLNDEQPGDLELAQRALDARSGETTAEGQKNVGSGVDAASGAGTAPADDEPPF